ncbi:MAG: hypothetical protein PWQ63_1453 [Methanolobus sp.]|nr:hypothetical protein [Methanolobus sp.]
MQIKAYMTNFDMLEELVLVSNSYMTSDRGHFD